MGENTTDGIVAFRCPPRLRARIEEVAEQRMTNMSTILRQVTAEGLGLEEYLEALEREEADANESC